VGLNSSPKMKTLTHRTLWSRGFGLSQSSFGESCSPPRSRSPFQDSSTSLLSIGRSAARILEVGTLGNHLVATVERRPNDGTGSNGERSGQGGILRKQEISRPSIRIKLWNQVQQGWFHFLFNSKVWCYFLFLILFSHFSPRTDSLPFGHA